MTMELLRIILLSLIGLLAALCLAAFTIQFWGPHVWDFKKWWKTRNKTLKDYDIEQTLVGPAMDGLLDFKFVHRIEWDKTYKREELGGNLQTSKASEKLAYLIKKRFWLSDVAYARAKRLEPKLELYRYRYGEKCEKAHLPEGMVW